MYQIYHANLKVINQLPSLLSLGLNLTQKQRSVETPVRVGYAAKDYAVCDAILNRISRSATTRISYSTRCTL